MLLSGTYIGMTTICPDTTKEETIQTANLYLAAALLAEGAKIVSGGIDRADPHRVRFTLSGEGIKKVQDDWWNGSSPYRQYSEKLRDLKDYIRM